MLFHQGANLADQKQKPLSVKRAAKITFAQ